MPMRRVVNLIEFLITEHMDDKQRRAFYREINKPLDRMRYKLEHQTGSPPAWWRGEEAAASDAADVMKFLRSL
jgi:hypothetical protein